MPTVPDSTDLVQPSKRGGRMSEDAVVEEVPVWLEVNGRPAVTWMCTPDLLEELAIGWLHGEGYIDSIEQVHLRPCATDLGFWAEVPRGAGGRGAGRRRASLCWPRGAAPSPPFWQTLPPSRPSPREERLRDWRSSAACSRHCSPRGSGTRTPAESTPRR